MSDLKKKNRPNIKQLKLDIPKDTNYDLAPDRFSSCWPQQRRSQQPHYILPISGKSGVPLVGSEEQFIEKKEQYSHMSDPNIWSPKFSNEGLSSLKSEDQIYSTMEDLTSLEPVPKKKRLSF